MSNKYDVLIIGCGNIGKRYLESLNNVLNNLKINVYIIDPNTENITSALKLCNSDLINNVKVIDYDYLQYLHKIDLAIVATCANIRKNIIINITDSNKIKYMILEKVLFNKIEDFDVIYQLLEKKQIKAWVNCPRRLWSVNQYIKNNHLKKGNTTMHIYGNNWNMACNAIHFIDLYSYFTAKKINKLFHHASFVTDSPNRKNYKEITGTIYADNKTNSGRGLVVSCGINTTYSLNMILINDNELLHVSDNRSISTLTIINSEKIKMLEFNNEHLSQQIHQEISNILVDGECNLPNYLESASCHKPMIEVFSRIFAEHGVDECPIT